MIRTSTALLAFTLIAGTVHAQHGNLPPRNPLTQPPTSAPATSTPAPENDAPLSGPKVGAGDTGGASIVEHDFEGKLRRPEGRPEVAALEKLSLTDEERKKIDAVLTQRAAELDTAVRTNIDLLLKGVTAKQSGDQAELRELMREYQQVFAPVLAKGQLSEQLAMELPKEKADHLRAMMREYWRAVYDDAAKEESSKSAAEDATHSERGGGAATRMRRVVIEEATRLFGQEVKASYDRIAAEGERRLQEVIDKLELTPEQEGEVRKLVSEFGEKTKRNPTARDKADLFRKVMAELSADQKQKLAELTLGSAK